MKGQSHFYMPKIELIILKSISKSWASHTKSKQNILSLHWVRKRSVIFEMSFGVHRLEPKQQQKYCKDFCPEIFCSFLGAQRLPGSFWDLLQASLLMILITRYPGIPKKLQGSPKEGTKNSGWKSLQYFRYYFGPNDDTKKTFQN